MAEFYFNLPPITQLTIDQQSALKSSNSIALTGGPGTGKSVVSLYRHITKTNNGKNCQLLTYTTSLALYLRTCCKKQNPIAAEKVSSTYQWILNPEPKDEIIIDEAQDVDISKYETLKLICNIFSYGADQNQSLYPENGSSLRQLQQIFPNTTNFNLTKNFRNTKSILRLAFNAFPYADISQNIIELCKAEGNKPFLLITNEKKFGISNHKQDSAILDIIKNFHTAGHNIAILCPWSNTVQHFYDVIKVKFPSATYYYRKDHQEHGCVEISNIHVTTFKSAKGLEFDTVIIPNFHKAFETLPPTFHVDWKDFYVGITRAKSNLYLISCESISQIKNCVEEENI